MRSSRTLVLLLPVLTMQACILYADGKGDTGSDTTYTGGGTGPGTTDTDDTVTTEDTDDTDDSGASVLDADGDGFEVGLDCDDTNAGINPDAEEVCGDGIDNNCDGISLGCRLEGEVDILDVADTIFQGSTAGEHFGQMVGAAGDVNADGLPDLLLASGSTPTTPRASVHIFLSPTSGLVNAAASDATLHSEVDEDGLGIGMAALGDMDGDGYGDFAIGAPYAPERALQEQPAWAVYIFTGPMSGDASVITADAMFPAETIGDRTGWRLGSPGDVTGDGQVDLLIASPSASLAAGDLTGKVWLVEGPWRREESLSAAPAVFTGEMPGSQAGSGAATSAGDVDGDGRADILISSAEVPVGGMTAKGAAYVITSSANGQIDLRYADVRLVGLSAGDRFGASATSAGDVNGDGYADVLIGATDSDLGASDAGSAHLFLGGPSFTGLLDAGDASFTLLGARAGGETGIAVSSVGDMDGDGNADIAVGDPVGVDSAGLGVVAVMYGPPVGTTDIEDADLLLVSDAPSTQMGASLAGPGDTNGDLLGEVLIGASLLSPSGAPEAGGGYLVRGAGG